jgi:parallel beta-helix repeat protein
MILLCSNIQAQNVIQVAAGTNQIEAAFFQAVEGDTIELITSGGLYQEDETVVNFFPLTVRAAEGLAEKPVWECGDNKSIKIKSDIWLSGIKMSGLFTDGVTDERDSTRYAIRTDDTMSVSYKVICENMDFDQFEYVFRADSGSFASEIGFANCTFTNIRYDAFRFRDYSTPPGQFEIFRAENCTAAEIRRYFLHADLYPQGEEMAKVEVNHCTFYNIGLEQFYQAVIRVDDTADIMMKNCLVNQTGRVVSSSQATVQYCNILDTGGYNIWSLPVIEHNMSEEPEFSDPENFDFSVSNRFAHIAIGDDGLVVGDPRWAPDSLNILYVPSEQYPTIQAGIDSAVNGDTVLVHWGTYVENINFKGKNILLGSRYILTGDNSFLDQTVIDGNTGGSVVVFDSGEDSTTVLKGFTIRNGNANQGGGVNISGSSPVLESLIIQDNTAINNGGGIFIAENSSPHLSNLTILNNTVTYDDGGGIAMMNSGGILESLAIRYNTVPSGVGGGIYLNNSSPSLVNCLLSNNISMGDGGGIVFVNGSNASLVNLTITANFANDGGGGFACETSSPVFLNSILAGNDAIAEPEFSIWDDESDPVFNFCNTEMEWTGENNFYADPLFLDSEQGDFRLSNLSPCIGSGTSAGAPNDDIEGNNRPDPPGSNPDIGAYENPLSEPWHAIISSSPSFFNQSVIGGETESQMLTIKNEGLAELTYNISTNFVTVLDSQNSALSFSDSVSYVEIANPDSFDLESDFTISAWVKTSSGGVIMSKTSGLDEPGPKTLWIPEGDEEEGGTVIFDIGFVGAVIGSIVVTDSIWHHIALTAEGPGEFLVKLYVDGILDTEEYFEVAEYSTVGYKMLLGFDGRAPDEFPTYHGSMDEVSIWGRALNHDEIHSIVNQPPESSDQDLMGYWAMDETSGMTCFDSSPKNNDGVISGSIDRTVSNVPYFPWMYCQPLAGNISPGSEMDVTVTFDASDLNDVAFLADLVIQSNDPDNPLTLIPVSLTVEPSAINTDQLLGVPKDYKLSQNFPNPFNPNTIINYELPISNFVELTIYNLLGQKVATLINEHKKAGYHQIEWDASEFASGAYYFHLKTGNFQDVKKMVLLR